MRRNVRERKGKQKQLLKNVKTHFMMKDNDGIEHAGMNMRCSKIYQSSQTFLEEQCVQLNSVTQKIPSAIASLSLSWG
jgi:hypothetical protein